MTVLVSGATGSVGGAVFRRLREHGVDVRGGTRRPDTAGLPDGTAVASTWATRPPSGRH